MLVYLSFTWSLGCLLPPPTLCSVEDGAEGAHPEAEYSGVIEAAPLRSLIVIEQGSGRAWGEGFLEPSQVYAK